MSQQRMQRAIDSTNLAWVDHEERDVDFLTAMAFAGKNAPLGGNLLVLKTATRTKSHFYMPGTDPYKRELAEAVGHLADACRARVRSQEIDLDVRKLLATLAITEWIDDGCRTCGGRGVMRNNKGNVVVTCLACGGTHKHRFSDADRCDALVLAFPKLDRPTIEAKYHSRWATVIARMIGIISCATAEHQRGTMRRLEK